MKKKILSILILAVLFSACKMKLSENTGTVVIDFRNDLRAVDENGLPDLNQSELTIKVTKMDGSHHETLIKEKTFSAAEPKTLSLTLPIDEKIKVRVRVKNVTAQWYGESEEHTVLAGSNHVSVKIKKSAVVMNSLLFGTNQSHTSYDPYTLTLNIGSKRIEKESVHYHSFCRDNKGRTYLVYLTQNTAGQSEFKLERYTSEGEKENKTFTYPAGCHRPMLASDHKTGAVYLIGETGGTVKLYRITENGGEPAELSGNFSVTPIKNYAVYSNVLIAQAEESGQDKLKMYSINGNTFSEITTPALPNLKDDTKIMLGSSLATDVQINDLYMTDNALYVLFSAFDNNKGNSGNYYSLGGIVKYSYTADGTISNPKRIGIKDSHTAQNGIYATHESDSFYGPVKVVGFDAENIYIADDGVRFEFQNKRPRVKENKNRIATLNKADNILTFEDTGAEWLAKGTVWVPPAANPLVFFSIKEESGPAGSHPVFKLEKLKLGSTDISSLLGAGNEISDKNISYTFDRDNNFYLAAKDKLKKFTKSSDSYNEVSGFSGSYSSSGAGQQMPYIKPAYDIVTETLYAIGDNRNLLKYDGSRWNPTSISDIEGAYTVYNEKAYMEGDAGQMSIQQVEDTISPSAPTVKIQLPKGAAYKRIDDIFFADDYCYVLRKSNFDNLATLTYFDVNTLPSNTSVPHPIPDGQMKELSIEGLTHFENLKFTGYRDGKLYIAVDGIKRFSVEGAPKLENINKTVSFNISAKTFDSPVNAPDGITWFREENEWHGTKTLVWKADMFPSGQKHYTYYQLDSANASLPSATVSFNPGDDSVSDNNCFTDVFCYDQDGNLYIAKYKQGAYYICRFELQDDGSYNTTPEIAELSDSGAPLSYKPAAIAVDISGKVKNGNNDSLNVLYYSYQNTDNFIRRLVWQNNDFGNASQDNGWNGITAPEIDSSSNENIYFTNLAANEDGLFVGEYRHESLYRIYVKKYAYNASDSYDYDSPTATVTIADEVATNNGIKEYLKALYIQDGVLYGLTTKEFRNDFDGYGFPQKVSISGKLWKIGKTDSDFGGSAQELHSSEPKTWPGSDEARREGGKFAPYRFIAIKPKKLVIASDGFYGYTEGTQRKPYQYNFIWNFPLSEDGSTTGGNESHDKDQSITFSKSLNDDSSFSWK